MKTSDFIKPKSEMGSKIQIDLSGPDGNAFVLLGIASNLSKQLGLDGVKVRKEMTSGDYDNLLDVFIKYFSEFVDMYQ